MTRPSLLLLLRRPQQKEQRQTRTRRQQRGCFARGGALLLALSLLLPVVGLCWSAWQLVTVSGSVVSSSHHLGGQLEAKEKKTFMVALPNLAMEKKKGRHYEASTTTSTTTRAKNHHNDNGVVVANLPQLSYVWNRSYPFFPTTNTNNVTLRRSEEPLPAWLETYITWHDEQRRTLTESNVRNHRFLVLRCLETDITCGGLSDRLKPIPLLLLLAAKSNRIFFIYWSRPCLLEEFLVPPISHSRSSQQQQLAGIDWTTPGWLARIMLVAGAEENHYHHNDDKTFHRHYITTRALHRGIQRNNDTILVSVRLQDQHGGSQLYNSLQQQQHNNTTEEEGPRAFRALFRRAWRVMFRPSPPLAAALREARWTPLPFSRNNDDDDSKRTVYAAAHLRALYDAHDAQSEAEQAKHVTGWAINAVHCASRLLPGVPVVFAADSAAAATAVRRYATDRHLPIYTLQRYDDNGTALSPLHLDRGGGTIDGNDKTPPPPPSAYFSVFIDLFLLSEATGGITHGRGGFGRLAVLLSRNASHFSTYLAKGQFVECSCMDIPH